MEHLINFKIGNKYSNVYLTENCLIGSLQKNNTDVDSIVPYRSQRAAHMTIIEGIKLMT